VKTYRIRWTYRFEREVEASSRKEALEICEDMGDMTPDVSTRATPMRIVGVVE
jgi:hypothetical protein